MALEDTKTQLDTSFTRKGQRGPAFENSCSGATSFLRWTYPKDLTLVDLAITKLPFVIAVAVAMLLAACVSPQDAKAISEPFYRAPTEAVMPDGVSEIRKGMTQTEVQRILGPKYSGYTSGSPIEPYSIVDVFEYSENGENRRISIWYIDTQVSHVVYGFDQSSILE